MNFLANNVTTSWVLLSLQPLLVLALAIIVSNFFGKNWKGLVRFTGALIRLVDTLNTAIAQSVKWLALSMVLMVAGLVITRYVFGLSAIKAQESVIYMHALLFMLAAPAALLTNTHVRVDIFYEKMSPRGRAWIDLAGTVFLLMPVCILIYQYGGDYASRAWAIHESSQESSGLPAVYLLKTAIPAFAMLMMLQGSAMAARAALILGGNTWADTQNTEANI